MSDEISSLYQVEEIPTARRRRLTPPQAAAGFGGGVAAPQSGDALPVLLLCVVLGASAGTGCALVSPLRGERPLAACALRRPMAAARHKNVCASRRGAARSVAAPCPARHGQPSLRLRRPAGARSRVPGVPPLALPLPPWAPLLALRKGRAVRHVGALALRCGALPPLVAPSLARAGLRSLRGVLARFALGGARAAGGGRRFPLARLAALGSPPPLPSGGFVARPCGRAFCGALRPPREKGFLSPLRRRHGGFLIPRYAAQQVEATCVAGMFCKVKWLCAPHDGHFKQNMIYFV